MMLGVTAIGGPAGAIIGVISAIAIEAGLQYFKEVAVSWVDDARDAILAQLLNKQGELRNVSLQRQQRLTS